MALVRRSILPVLLVSLALVAAACGGTDGDDEASPAATGQAAGSADLDEGVAAIVDGEEIETETLRSRVEAAAESPQLAQQLDGPQGELVRAQLQAQTLTQLIFSEIILQEASARGIEVSDEAIADKRGELEEQAGGAEAFEESIAQAALTDVEVEEQLRIAVVIDRIAADLDVEAAPSPAPGPTPTAAPAPDPTEQALGQEIQRVVQAAEVTVDEEFGSWNPQRGQVVPPQPQAPPQPPGGQAPQAPQTPPTPAPTAS